MFGVLDAGAVFGIHSIVDLCRFCVFSLHREVGGVRHYNRLKTTVHSAEGCCIAATMDLTSIKQKFLLATRVYFR